MGRWIRCLLLLLVAFPSLRTRAEESTAMQKLQEVQELVGQWHGIGTIGRSKSWKESVHCQWDLADEQPMLELAIEGEDENALFEQASLTYDSQKGDYVLTAKLAGGDSEVEFRGQAKTPQNLILDRVAKGRAKDDLDRIDLKVLNEGDRLVYSLHRRIGMSRSYRQVAQIGLNRQGTSLASTSAGGPKCIVTGGAGTMAVTYQGMTYYVCCTGCKAAFDDDPEKYIARANMK